MTELTVSGGGKNKDTVADAQGCTWIVFLFKHFVAIRNISNTPQIITLKFDTSQVKTMGLKLQCRHPLLYKA